MLEDDKIFSVHQEEQIKRAFSLLAQKTQTENLNPEKALEEIRRKLPKETPISTNEHYGFKPHLKIKEFLDWLFLKPNMSYAFSAMLITISAGITHLVVKESDSEIIIRSLPPTVQKSLGAEDARRRQVTPDEAQAKSETLTIFSRPTLIVANKLPLSGDMPGWLEVTDVAVAAGYKVSISKSEDSSTRTISLYMKKSQVEKDITLRLLLGIDESFEGEILVTFD